jgi:peptide chain release factor 3
MTCITNVWSSIRADTRYVEFEQGDQVFALNPFYQQAKDDIELMTEAGNPFDAEAVLAGDFTPVFFGSALTNFGVQTFLDSFLDYAPEPQGHKTTTDEVVSPTTP